MNAISPQAEFVPAVDPHAVDALARKFTMNHDCEWSMDWARVRARTQLIEEARLANRLSAMSLDELCAEKNRLDFEAWAQPVTQNGNATMTRLWATARKVQSAIYARETGEV